MYLSARNKCIKLRRCLLLVQKVSMYQIWLLDHKLPNFKMMSKALKCVKQNKCVKTYNLTLSSTIIYMAHVHMAHMTRCRKLRNKVQNKIADPTLRYKKNKT